MTYVVCVCVCVCVCVMQESRYCILLPGVRHSNPDFTDMLLTVSDQCTFSSSRFDLSSLSLSLSLSPLSYPLPFRDVFPY